MTGEAGSARLLPGQGSVDDVELLDVLRASGAQPFVAPEVFNPGLVRSLGPAGAARAALDATAAVLGP